MFSGPVAMPRESPGIGRIRKGFAEMVFAPPSSVPIHNSPPRSRKIVLIRELERLRESDGLEKYRVNVFV
jgi:hypothetical protein